MTLAYAAVHVAEIVRRAGAEGVRPVFVIDELRPRINPRFDEDTVRNAMWRLLDRHELELTNNRKLRVVVHD